MIGAVIPTQQAIYLESHNKYLNLLSININSSQGTINTINMKDHEHHSKKEIQKRNH